MEEEKIQGLGDFIKILIRRKNQFLVPVIVIFFVSIFMAMSMPSIYRSEATILVEQQEIPADLVRSTVTSYAGERIQVISQRVMTRENLSRIIDKYNLYKEKRSDVSINKLAGILRNKIELEMISADIIDPRSGRPTTATIAFKISFSNEDPYMSQQVTNEIVSLFLNENKQRRTKSALETSEFLTAEAEKLKKNVDKLENQLAEFKEKNIHNLPEHQQLYLQLMERKEMALANNIQQMRTLEERKIYLQTELAQMRPKSDIYTSNGKRVFGIEDRLMTLQTEYVGLKTKYTDQYPPLIKLKEEIDALKSQIGVVGDVKKIRQQLYEQKLKLDNLKELYPDQHQDIINQKRLIEYTQASLNSAMNAKQLKSEHNTIRTDNPAYKQLQIQLNATEAELSALSPAKGEIEDAISSYESRLMQSPQVEKEYRNMTRDYDNALAKYNEVKAKQLEAELAESLELEHKGERFSLIDPPLLPEGPAKPNRMAIVLIGFMASFVGGVGYVVIRENVDPAVYGSKGVMNVIGAPPVVVIPYIENSQDRVQKHRKRILLMLGIITIFIGSLVIVHNKYVPMGDLYDILLEKIGTGTR